ncbi:helix-turn-helix transcriptional regulator [Pseudomonas sp.]|uniref:helix-turn-helix domain-containing protein n=1 Tax=Pseudomonas sp. TaxID=306 RepID=UPI002589FC3E|nr:helix-turn-helix transcriptional regulator [Pseudomonas sp.]
MSLSTQFRNELLIHTSDWSKNRGDASSLKTGSGPAQVHVAKFEVRVSRLAAAHSDFADLEAELEGDSSLSEELAKAGNWVANELYTGQEETVKVARLRKGFSQKQLAELIGSSQPHIANIEKGDVNVMFSTVEKLCNALEITPNDFQKMTANQKAIRADKEGK